MKRLSKDQLDLIIFIVLWLSGSKLEQKSQRCLDMEMGILSKKLFSPPPHFLSISFRENPLKIQFTQQRNQVQFNRVSILKYNVKNTFNKYPNQKSK